MLSNRLTVVFRDDSPMIHAGDSPSYRSVLVELTQEQMAQLEAKHELEHFSKCFIEPDMREVARAGK